jgi:hypothetical protein
MSPRYASDRRPEVTEAASYWPDRDKSQTGSQGTSYLEAPSHCRLQGTDDAAVLGTLNSVLLEGQPEGQDRMVPSAWVSTS